MPRPGAAGGIPGAKGITAGSSQRRVQRSVVRAPAAHCARCEWGARTNQRLVLPPGPRPSCPLPGDPDVTGTFPPPPPQAPLAEPRGCRRARAASCPAQSGGRVRAPKPVPDAPPAPERALPRASPALGPPLASPPTQLHLRPPPSPPPDYPLRSGDCSPGGRARVVAATSLHNPASQLFTQPGL